MITYLERQSARENSLGQSSSVDHECARKIVAIPSRILFLLSLRFFLLSLSFSKETVYFRGDPYWKVSPILNFSFRLNGKFDSVFFSFARFNFSIRRNFKDDNF